MTIGFKIIGISTRTTNKDNHSADDLSKLWERFHSEHIFDKIPNKISEEVYSVYTDYKSDYTEDYTTIIGVPVSTLSYVPDELMGREFGAENFRKFTATGDMPETVIKTWLKIWDMDKELDRKYTFDFEVYGPNCLVENSEVSIYIAVK